MKVFCVIAVFCAATLAAPFAVADDPNGLDALKAAATKGCPCGASCPCGPLCDCDPCGCATKDGKKAYYVSVFDKKDGGPKVYESARPSESLPLPHAPAEVPAVRSEKFKAASAAFAGLFTRGLANGTKVVIGLNCPAPAGPWEAIEASELDGFRPGTGVLAYVYENSYLHGGYRMPEDASQSEIKKMLEKASEPVTPAPQIQQQPQVVYMMGGYGGGGSCASGSCGSPMMMGGGGCSGGSCGSPMMGGFGGGGIRMGGGGCGPGGCR